MIIQGTRTCRCGYRLGMSEDVRAMLEVALGEARRGFDEGGIPIGAALYSASGALTR
jgi:hypothetical protein